MFIDSCLRLSYNVSIKTYIKKIQIFREVSYYDKKSLLRYTENGRRYFGCISLCRCFSYILVPLNLYSGGFTGISQVLMTLLEKIFHITFPTGIDFTGIFLWILNIPLFFLAWKTVSRTFFLKTVCTVFLQSFFMAVIPAAQAPVVSDKLVCCLIGGAVSGFGVGLTLKCGSSGGGTDIVGIYCSKKFPDFSVGKLTLLVQMQLFILSAALNNSLETAIYSIIFCYAASVMMDKIHYQNIMTNAFIITKTNPNLIGNQIISDLNRSYTTWTGESGYKKEPIQVIMTIISKYESQQLKQIVASEDPDAFITYTDH